MLTKSQIAEIFDKIRLSCIVYLDDKEVGGKEPDRFITDIKGYIKEYEKSKGR